MTQTNHKPKALNYSSSTTGEDGTQFRMLDDFHGNLWVEYKPPNSEQWYSQPTQEKQFKELTGRETLIG